MPFILGANTLSTGAYEVANSVRFNGADSPALKRNSMGTATNRKKWTLSMWVKRSTTDQRMLASFDGAASYFQFQSGGQLEVNDVPGSSFNYRLVTDAVYRDVSAWMHIVVAYDSTQGTDTNRLKLYVNGAQPTLETATYPDQNFESEVNSTGSHKYGSYDDSADYAFNGYFAEIVFIDGTQYAASDFGEFDEDSPQIWKPKKVSGLTFGTNGHYLDFEDSSNLGNDKNGGTDFDENNIAATDQSTDTCTNNFCTMNSLVNSYSTNVTFSEGNLKCTHPGVWGGVPGTMGVQNGRWYWEVKVTTGNSANAFTGIVAEDVDYLDATVYDETGLLLYFVDGRKTVDGTDSESFFDSLATDDIVGVHLDLDSSTKQVTFTKNGSTSGSAVNLTANHTGKFVLPVSIGNSSSATANWEFNFGSPSYSISSGNADDNGYGNFEYPPNISTTKYYALCTKNLAEFG